jgi:molybdopterin converting factor subunit 1
LTLTVLLFAKLRDIAGADSVRIELPDGARVGALRRQLADTYRALTGLLERSAIAVNHDFADDERILRPGDEIAVVPPVSGG